MRRSIRWSPETNKLFVSPENLKLTVLRIGDPNTTTTLPGTKHNLLCETMTGVLFSGSLYVYCLTGVGFWVGITPLEEYA